MLRIKNLKSGYNKMEILHGINMQVDHDEIVAIIGPNGAGKSTILKSIFGLADVTGGNISFNKKVLTNLQTHQIISHGISYVPQGRQVFSNLTVLENLEMGGFVYSKEKVKNKVNKIFKQFPVLAGKEKHKAFTLSGGQQQLLAIARSLIQEPSLLLLDEPSLGLDPKTMKEVFEHIQKINKAGTAILIVEQNARQAVNIANRTYVLVNGQVAFEGGKEILKNSEINKVYLGG